MFFMGGMTLGYLQPPVRAKRVDANLMPLDEDGIGTQRLPSATISGDGAIERTLLWARRILC
jgi:hypothetical protein